MRKRVELQTGLYIAVNKVGEVCRGHRTGPKLYIHEKVAIRKAGQGGKVFLVTDNQVTQIYPFRPKTFFLNERHEIRDDKCKVCLDGSPASTHVHR